MYISLALCNNELIFSLKKFYLKILWVIIAVMKKHYYLHRDLASPSLPRKLDACCLNKIVRFFDAKLFRFTFSFLAGQKHVPVLLLKNVGEENQRTPKKVENNDITRKGGKTVACPGMSLVFWSDTRKGLVWFQSMRYGIWRATCELRTPLRPTKHLSRYLKNCLNIKSDFEK